MRGTAHPPSLHCTSSKTSCWEGGGLTPLASVCTLMWAFPQEGEAWFDWLQKMSLRYICKRSISDCETQSECHFLGVRMKGTSLASIFSDLDSYPSDNESVRAGHTSAVLKCELFKIVVWCNGEQRLVWERRFCGQMSQENLETCFPEANLIFPDKFPVRLVIGKATCLKNSS